MVNIKVIHNDVENIYKGILIKDLQKYYAKLEVKCEENLNNSLDNIQGYIEELGEVTLVNCMIESITNISNNNDYLLYTYVASYCITNHIDHNKLNINYISVYYKEFDYFFIKDRFKIKSDLKSLNVKQKYVNELLLENNNVKISYFRTAGIKVDEYGNKLLKNPANLEIIFKNNISINVLDEELRKIENSFGFVINRKMNLLKLSVGSDNGNFYEVFPKYIKKYEDIILHDFHIVDITSKNILKDVLKKYYEDAHISASINMYYEYIYNDLDNIFEFTSLVNTIELILSSKKYREDLKKYVLENDIELFEKNKKIENIIKKLPSDDSEIISSIYNCNYIELRKKFNYILYKIFKLKRNEKSNEYISKIINTRNYYVHGTENKKKLNSIDLVITKNLLNNMLYLLIMNSCTNKKNILIDTYSECIPIIYTNIIGS